jgi:ubiquinol-cytochrome c reductase cytochrome c subunit
VTALAARRRHPLASVVLVLLGLIITGCGYAALAPVRANAAAGTADQIAAGRNLFLANCSDCHGRQAEGKAGQAPSLVGAGAAAVDFQVGTGRMPMAVSGPQARQGPQVKYTPEQISALAAYVASLGPGPSIPDAAAVDPTDGNISKGSLIFRTNCAMCHSIAGKGGALTRGKYAPNLDGVTPTHIYEALVTGPQSMPVFNDQNLDPQSKRDVIAYLQAVQEAPTPGGLSLGALGPVSEGLVAWVVGLMLLIGCAVWLGAKAS